MEDTRFDALLTTGVAAVWPQIETAVVKDGFVVSQTCAARSGSITPIDFDALPEGSTVLTSPRGEVSARRINTARKQRNKGVSTFPTQVRISPGRREKKSTAAKKTREKIPSARAPP